MSLPVFFAPTAAEAHPGSVLTLGEDVAGHAVRVRRLRVGQSLELVDGNGIRARATITSASNAELSVLIDTVESEPEPHSRLVLVQALAKGDRDLQAVEQATEIGVDEVIPWAAERSIADWPEKKRQRMAAKWDHLLTAASLQARRSRFPHLGDLVRGTDFAQSLRANDLICVLHETATEKLSDVLTPAAIGAAERIVLVVGPEGGITDSEIAVLSGTGATAVRLGRTILRSSSAGPAGLVLAQRALGHW